MQRRSVEQQQADVKGEPVLSIPGEFQLSCVPADEQAATIPDYDLKIQNVRVLYENGELMMTINPGDKEQIFSVDTAEGIVADEKTVSGSWPDEDTFINLKSSNGSDYNGDLVYIEDFLVPLSCKRSSI